MDHSYIKEHGSKSILCFPLLNLGDLRGLLYLENNLSEGVFTQDRLEVLQLLSTQIAISIDNALFYQELEAKVKARTKALKDAQNQLIEKEKMASLGMITTGIAHEIKNPLNFIVNFAELSNEILQDFTKNLEEHPKQPLNPLDLLDFVKQLQTYNETIYKHGKKADMIINRMEEHSQQSGREFMPTNIHHLLDEAIESVAEKSKKLYPDLTVAIEKKYDSSALEITASSQDLKNVFANLLDNAYYALHRKKLPSKEPFHFLIAIQTNYLGDELEIKIRDNGIGISNEQKEKIFTPFFTTRPTGEGVGLGLSLSHNIITQQHMGTLVFDSVQGEFTEFTMRLPYTGL